MKRIKTRRKHFRITNPLGFSLFCAICVLAVGLVVGIVCLAVGYGEDVVKYLKAQLNGTPVTVQATDSPTPEPTATMTPTDSAVETPDTGTPVPETPTPAPIDPSTPAPQNTDTQTIEKDPNAPLYGFTIGLDPTRDGDSKYKAECEFNLAFAKQLASYLESKGATVVLTREDNSKGYSNSNRAKTIKSAECNIALRLLCNHVSGKTSGCYVQTSKNNKSYGQALISAYSAQTGIQLQRGKKNGLETKSDEVASKCGCPCILLVMGNWENKSERSNLEDDAFRDKMIKAIYETMLSQLKS